MFGDNYTESKKKLNSAKRHFSNQQTNCKRLVHVSKREREKDNKSMSKNSIRFHLVLSRHVLQKCI